VETRDSSPLPPGSLRLQGDAPPLALLISLGPSLRRLRTRAGTEGRKCLSLARCLDGLELESCGLTTTRPHGGGEEGAGTGSEKGFALVFGASSWTGSASDPDQTFFFTLHVGPARNVLSPKVL
jgi:hypothetical protein